MPRTDLTGRIVGMLAFLIGVAVLAFVFYNAYLMFTSNACDVQIPTASTDKTAPSPTTQLGASAVVILARVLALVVMTVAGSMIASRGIHLYFAASGAHPGRRAERPPDEG